MSKRILVLALAACAVISTVGCAHSGMSSDVRSQITATMETARGPITTCYGQMLKIDRREKGTIDLTFNIEPNTGKFKDVQVTRDDMNDKKLEECVTGAVGGLTLQTPQKSNISVPSYPMDFAPVK